MKMDERGRLLTEEEFERHVQNMEDKAQEDAIAEADAPFWDMVWGRLDAASLKRDFPDARRELAYIHGRGLFAKRKGEGVPIDQLADELKTAMLLPEDADSSTLVEMLKDKKRPSRRRGSRRFNQTETPVVRDGIVRKPDDATAKVISIPQNAVQEFARMKDFAEWVKNMLAAGGNVTIKSTGQEARFSSKNVRASVKRSRAEEHRNAYKGLREMVENAEYDHYEPADERHPGRGGQDVYYSALAMGGKLYSVKIKLDVATEIEKTERETQEDVRYKDHKLTEIEIASVKDHSEPQKGLAAHVTDAISEVSLGVLRGVVKPSGIDGGILFQTVRTSKTSIAAIRRKYKGTAAWMKAPNGKPTKLNERQWLQVRTPEFKAWFGDWENDPANASKVVDENGEPLVVYHQTDVSGIEVFDISKARQDMDIPAFFFSSGTEDWAEMGGNVIPAFLNLRNPKQGKPLAGGKGREVRQKLEAEGYDGTIEVEEDMETEYAAFYPNQIKSAVDNAGTFDAENPNILYQTAWHGSRVKFDKPSTDAIGSGVGAQWHGWGLYYAGEREVGEHYRGKNGQLFEVDIPENDVLLDEQKKFSEQPEKVQKALKKLGWKSGSDVLYNWDAERFLTAKEKNSYEAKEVLKGRGVATPFIIADKAIGREIYNFLAKKKGSPRAASEAMNKAGIKGITYDDRHDGRCFVVFDDKAIKVLKTYYQGMEQTADEAFASGLEDKTIIAMQHKIREWLSPENLAQAQGKTREEIFTMFGNELEPIAVLPSQYLHYFRQPGSDNRIYSGKGYFIDHAVNHHPEVLSERYQDIQIILNSPDEVLLDRRTVNNKVRDGLIFVKELDANYAVTVAMEEDNHGKIVMHKTFFKTKKNPFKKLERVPTSVGGVSTISHAAETAPGSSLSARDGERNIPPLGADGKPLFHDIPSGVPNPRPMSAADIARGFVTIANGQEYTIQLLKRANLSTILHETGHIALLEMNRLVCMGMANESLARDYATLRDYLGLKDGDDLSAAMPEMIAANEKFAKTMELYLREGKAPSKGLESAFARFKRWLTRIYREIVNDPYFKDVELNDDVRQVLDRLLATEDEIRRASEKVGISDDIRAELDALGLTGKHRARVTSLMQEAQEQAEENLRKVRDAHRTSQLAVWKKQAHNGALHPNNVLVIALGALWGPLPAFRRPCRERRVGVL